MANSSPTALVLGASGTLGGAMARRLSSQGYRLGLHACAHPERCPDLPDSKVFEADFRDPQSVPVLCKTFLKEFERVDVLIWAAGIVKDQLVTRLNEDDLRDVLAVNLTAPFLLAKSLTRAFIKQRSGAFMVLSSHAAFRGRVGGAAYAMAQSGLLAMVKSLAREWGLYGVRVNALVPPFVADSEMGQAASSAFVEHVASQNVLKSDADPIEGVARFACELAGNEQISGQIIVLDSRISQ